MTDAEGERTPAEAAGGAHLAGGYCTVATHRLCAGRASARGSQLRIGHRA